MTTIADSRTRVARPGAHTVTAPVLAQAPDTFPFPSKNRSRTTTQRWVRKCGRSVANSETPQRAWEAHTTPPTTITLIDQLLEDHTYDQTVEILNDKELTGGWGKPFSVPSLTQLCKNRGIASHHERLRATGMLTLEEIAAQLGVTSQTIKIWQRRGQITGRRIDGRREHLYHPDQTRPTDGRRRSQPRAVAARHHDRSPAADGITTTTTPGGAV